MLTVYISSYSVGMITGYSSVEDIFKIALMLTFGVNVASRHTGRNKFELRNI
jgi:hypothetical protein